MTLTAKADGYDTAFMEAERSYAFAGATVSAKRPATLVAATIAARLKKVFLRFVILVSLTELFLIERLEPTFFGSNAIGLMRLVMTAKNGEIPSDICVEKGNMRAN